MSNKYTLKHLFSENIKGIIWKIILDDLKELLWMESRTENKEVYFYAYDFNLNRFLVKEKVFDDKWFISLSGAYNGVAYFHGFENEFSPARKGIIAYDVYNDKVLWQNYSYSLEYISEDGIVAFDSKIQPKKMELLDRQTGLLLKAVKTEEPDIHPPVQNNILIPDAVWDNNILNSYQTLKTKDLTFKTFYLEEEKYINQVIHIFYKNELIFTDYLNTDIQKPANDTFFVWLNKLVYLRNKSEIVSYLV